MLLILLGLIGLWLGTRWIINGALGIAQRFNLSHSFVGVAILAVGTDLPEVFVSIKASLLQLEGIESSGIITGNAIGSSISQITLILGVSGLLLRFSMEKENLWRDGIALVSSTVLVILFGLDGIISRWEGAILIFLYILYYVILLRSRTAGTEDREGTRRYSAIALVAFLVFGLVTLILSSHLVVENAMALAGKWGVAQSFIGIAIVGVGTSLPELAVSIGAAARKSTGMSVGNIIGSNIFDGFIPIGLGAVISATSIERGLLRFDLPLLLAVTLLVLILLKTKRGISTIEGSILISIFVLYLAAKIFLASYLAS